MSDALPQKHSVDPKRSSVSPTLLVVLVFSIFYFADVLIRQSEKYFWYDELCTVLYCRLNLHDLARAAGTGLDLSPLPFHLLTKASQAILGAGRLGTRAPEILGFWIMCLCLFRFAHRRLGLAAGVIAMLFPLFTESLYYAYEARPYGLILGFCGTALVSWQMLIEGKRPRLWLSALSVSLLCSFLLHFFSLLIEIPFCLAELYQTIRTKTIQWSFWVAITAPVMIAVLAAIPEIRVYRKVIHNSMFVLLVPHDWGQISRFYVTLLSPSIGLIIIALAIIATTLICSASEQPAAPQAHLVDELIVALSFTALPLFGILLAKTIHAVFFTRYFVSALVGFSLLLAFAFCNSRLRRFGRPAFAVLLAIAAALQVGQTLWNHFRNIPNLLPEPSSGFALNVTRGGPLGEFHALLGHIDATAPIAITDPIDFLYLVYYSPELRPRLYYLAMIAQDPFPRVLDGFRPLSPVPYNSCVDFQQTLHLARHVAVLGTETTRWIVPFLDSGAHLQWLKAANNRFVAEIEHE